MKKQALLVIDLQNDYYPGGKWELEGVEEASQNAAQLIEKARKDGQLVVHVQHVNPFVEAPFFVEGTPGADIHQDVTPIDGEKVVVKQQANSFRDTNLKKYLDENGVEKLVICGAMSHMCVHAATRASADFGYETVVVHDACATRELEFNGVSVPAKQVHAAFMAAAGFGYAQLISTKELRLVCMSIV